MARQWTGEEILAVVRDFQPACVIAAAAELDLFSALADGPQNARSLAERLGADLRGVTILLDALTAMELLTADSGRYAPAPGAAEALCEGGERNVLAMVRHQVNCLRGWSQLAHVVRDGTPAERTPSIRGAEADQAAFVEAMNVVSRPAAEPLVSAIGPPSFTHLLDVGGGPATWTIAFLRAMPGATATLFDRPTTIPIARTHVAAAGMDDRVRLVGGDFEADALPAGADLAWVSAIVHMNSRQENRDLLAKVYAALVPGGRVLIRDVVMDESRTEPADGALFAVNMLVHTPGGGTFTFAELSEDLAATGFVECVLLHEGQFMDSVVLATRP